MQDVLIYIIRKVSSSANSLGLRMVSDVEEPVVAGIPKYMNLLLLGSDL